MGMWILHSVHGLWQHLWEALAVMKPVIHIILVQTGLSDSGQREICNSSWLETCLWARWKFRSCAFLYILSAAVLVLSRHIFISPRTRNSQRRQMHLFGKRSACSPPHILYVQSLLLRLFPHDASVPDRSDSLSFHRGWQLCRRTVTSCETSSPNIEESAREPLHTRASQKPVLHRESTVYTHDDNWHSVCGSLRMHFSKFTHFAFLKEAVLLVISMLI